MSYSFIDKYSTLWVNVAPNGELASDRTTYNWLVNGYEEHAEEVTNPNIRVQVGVCTQRRGQTKGVGVLNFGGVN